MDSGTVDLQLRDSFIVFGFIRLHVEPEISHWVIPSVIISVCASYYHWSFGFEAIRSLSECTISDFNLQLSESLTSPRSLPTVVEIAGPRSETVRTLPIESLPQSLSSLASPTPIVRSQSDPNERLFCAFGHQWIESLSG